MDEVELILPNFDARIPKVEIRPKNIDSKVIITSKMYNEESDKELTVKIYSDYVAAIDFIINFFYCMIGAEAFGLYRVHDSVFAAGKFMY